MAKKLLFISHDASRTGAPILLLSLARLLKRRTDYEIDFLLKLGGVLENEYRALGKVTILFEESGPLLMKGFKKVRSKLWRKLKRQFIDDYEVIVSNTITNGNLHDLLSCHSIVFTYVHELPATIKACTSDAQVRNVLEHTRMFLVPSRAVEQNLLENYRVEQKRIAGLPYYIPDHFEGKDGYRNETRRSLGIAENSFVVGGMGAPGWRKGADVFLQVARKALKSRGNLKFIWCGGEPNDPGWQTMLFDVQKMGLEASVLLVPNSSEPWKMMAAFDVFLLSSREDPYPLVVLEAAMMALPIICFRQSGGAIEFVGEGSGCVVDYLDIDGVCEAVSLLSDNRNTYLEYALNARTQYLSKHTEDEVYNAFIHTLNY